MILALTKSVMADRQPGKENTHTLTHTIYFSVRTFCCLIFEDLEAGRNGHDVVSFFLLLGKGLF